jgi:uncharacterized damage-inducible protein DinB
MTETSRIADQLRRSYAGNAWQGPSLREALDGVTPEVADRRASPDVHTIREIVDHVATWAAAARRFLDQNYYVSLTGDDDWPPPVGDWTSAVDKLAGPQQQLWEYVETLPDERLDNIVSAEKGYTIYIVLHGIVQHNLYHAGQISLLKKLPADENEIIEIIRRHRNHLMSRQVYFSSDGPKDLTQHELCGAMAMDYNLLLDEIEEWQRAIRH